MSSPLAGKLLWCNLLEFQHASALGTTPPNPEKNFGRTWKSATLFGSCDTKGILPPYMAHILSKPHPQPVIIQTFTLTQRCGTYPRSLGRTSRTGPCRWPRPSAHTEMDCLPSNTGGLGRMCDTIPLGCSHLFAHTLHPPDQQTQELPQPLALALPAPWTEETHMDLTPCICLRRMRDW
jgi:hypothetical protein